MVIAPLIMWTGPQLSFRWGDKVALMPQESFIAETAAKKTATKAAVKKGFNIVTPERKVGGPPKESKYEESQRGYYARKYIQIHSNKSSPKEGGWGVTMKRWEKN